jgi:hypothetical protein
MIVGLKFIIIKNDLFQLISNDETIFLIKILKLVLWFMLFKVNHVGNCQITRKIVLIEILLKRVYIVYESSN